MGMKKMQTLRNTNLMNCLFVNLVLHSFLSIAVESTNISFCGSIRIQQPFSLKTPTESSPLSRILLCRSEKLYFRTSLGLFEVSSIDYNAKTFTVSHSSCSSSLHFISPSILSAGFPSTSQPNSLLLFNCKSQRKPASSFNHNCTSSNGCKDLSVTQQDKTNESSSCWFIEDTDKLETGFDPKDLRCSHYNRVYKDPAASSLGDGFQLGTRISFGVPDHVPNICDECTKPHGNCGVGLQCVCHLKLCKETVHSGGISKGPVATILVSLLAFAIMAICFK